MRRLVGALMVSGSLLAAGCGGDGGQQSATPPAATAGAEAGGPVGLKECDDYLSRMEACLPKLAEAARGPLATALGKQRANFRQVAASPSGRVSLEASCKQLLANVENSPACK